MDSVILAVAQVIFCTITITGARATVMLIFDLLFGKSGFFSSDSDTDIGGASSWKDRLPDIRGINQFPLNIASSSAIVVCSDSGTIPSLAFSPEYSANPQEMRAYNDGQTVTLDARWSNHKCPKISGGCLPCEYQFLNIRFRWGPNDEEGSEYTINGHRYPLELQAAFVKTDKLYKNLVDAVDQNALLIISSLYRIGRTENPSLNTITNCLDRYPSRYEYYDIDPVPLSCLMPTFSSKYYTYNGSLGFPPCSERVLWIVQSELLVASHSQISKFRKLSLNEDAVDVNSEPIQDICGRQIFFYD